MPRAWAETCSSQVSTGPPSPGDLPDPGVEPMSPALQADSLLPEPPGEPEEVLGKP